MEPDFPEQIQKPLSLDDDIDYFDEPEPSSLSPTTSTSTSTSTTTTTTTPSTTKSTTTTTRIPSTSTTRYTTSTTTTSTTTTPSTATREVKRGRGRHIQRRPQTVDVYDIPKSVTPAFKPLPTASTKRDSATTPKSSFFSFFDMFLDHSEQTTIQPQKASTTQRLGTSAFDFFTTTISPFVRSFGVPHTTTKESAFERIFGSTSPKPWMTISTSTRPTMTLTTRPALFFFPQNHKNFPVFRNGSAQVMKPVNTQTIKPFKRGKDGKKLMKKPRRRKTTTTSTTTTTSATTLENTKKYLNKYSKRFRNMTMNLNFMKNKATITPSTTTTTTSTSIPPTGTNYDETTFSFDKMTTTVGGIFNIETMLPTSGESFNVIWFSVWMSVVNYWYRL